jgi:hypothetical protein
MQRRCSCPCRGSRRARRKQIVIQTLICTCSFWCIHNYKTMRISCKPNAYTLPPQINRWLGLLMDRSSNEIGCCQYICMHDLDLPSFSIYGVQCHSMFPLTNLGRVQNRIGCPLLHYQWPHVRKQHVRESVSCEM